MIDEATIQRLVDHLSAPELVDTLGLTTEEIIDAFETEVQQKLSEIEDIYGISLEEITDNE